MSVVYGVRQVRRFTLCRWVTSSEPRSGDCYTNPMRCLRRAWGITSSPLWSFGEATVRQRFTVASPMRVHAVATTASSVPDSICFGGSSGHSASSMLGRTPPRPRLAPHRRTPRRHLPPLQLVPHPLTNPHTATEGNAAGTILRSPVQLRLQFNACGDSACAVFTTLFPF